MERARMMSVSVSVDVPGLAAGVRFYASAIGFEKQSELVPGVAVLRAADSDPFGRSCCIIERSKT